MYFVDDEHRFNYEKLLKMYKYTRDSQYKANIYVASYPDLFNNFRLHHLDLSQGPLVQLIHSDDEESTAHLHRSGLTGLTTELVEFGNNLYNGSYCDLSRLCSRQTEIVEFLIQAIRISGRMD